MQAIREVLDEFRQAGRATAGNDEAAEHMARARAERKAAAAQRTVAYFASLAQGAEPAKLDPTAEIIGLRDDGLPPCRTCRGLRFVRVPVPVGDDRFGKAQPCPDCLSRPEVAPRLAADRAINAGLSWEQLAQSFETFRPSKLSQAAYDAALDWSRRVTDWLVIHGEPGSGKSHLAAAVVNRLAGSGRQVRYWYAADLARAAKRQIGQGGNAEDEFVESVKALPALIIDDLGAAQLTDYVLRVFEEIIDHRYRHRLATMVTLISAPSVARDDLSESICRRFEDPRICKVVHNAAPQWSGKVAS